MADFIVDPGGSGDFTSIVAARNYLRGILPSQSQNHVVKLRGSTYRVSGGTLAFNEQDRGRNGYTVTWTRYGNEFPIITGCVAPASGDWSHVGGGVYACDLSAYGIPEIGAMWERGVACYIAGNEPSLRKTSWRNPTQTGPHTNGNPYNQTWMDFPSGTIPSGVNADGNLRLQAIPRYKEQTRVITSVSGNRVHWDGWFYVSGDRPKTTQMLVRLYNHRNLLTRPGQFYYDRSARIMYYMPRTLPIQVEIPRLGITTPVVTLEGGSTRLSNFILEWWTIQGSNRPIDGHPTHSVYNTYPALRVNNANSLIVRNCRIRQTGHDGIGTGTGAPSLLIDGCLIYDIGKNGIMINGGLGDSWWYNNTSNTVGGTIYNTRIYNCGDAKYGSCGIAIRFQRSGGWTVRYSDISDAPDCLVNVEAHTLERCSSGYQFLNNRWHGPACRNRDDTAMFYANGTFQDSNFIGNVFEDWSMDGECAHPDWFGGVIYCDNLPESITVEDNIFMNIGANPVSQVRAITWLKGRWHTIRNNIFYKINIWTGLNYSLCHLNSDSRNTCNGHRSEKNIYHTVTCYYPGRNPCLYWVLSHNADYRYSLCNTEVVHNVTNPRYRDGRFGMATMSTWQDEYRFQRDSRIENPRFTAPDAGDFSFLSGSPCPGMGIKALNRNMAGLRTTFPSWDGSEPGDPTPPTGNVNVAVARQQLSVQMLPWPADTAVAVDRLRLRLYQRPVGSARDVILPSPGGVGTSVHGVTTRTTKPVAAQPMSVEVLEAQTTTGHIVYLRETLGISAQPQDLGQFIISSTVPILYPLRMSVRQSHAIGYDPDARSIFDGKMRKVIFAVRRM
jgi:hypothetical protein